LAGFAASPANNQQLTTNNHPFGPKTKPFEPEHVSIYAEIWPNPRPRR
jgi:hypothetical protein